VALLLRRRQRRSVLSSLRYFSRWSRATSSSNGRPQRHARAIRSLELRESRCTRGGSKVVPYMAINFAGLESRRKQRSRRSSEIGSVAIPRAFAATPRITSSLRLARVFRKRAFAHDTHASTVPRGHVQSEVSENHESISSTPRYLFFEPPLEPFHSLV